ncbi:MAG: methionine--tRNA ligase [Bacteroidetes bacterium]|nr:methionine--tRNA ligase [Bacteroidota bacterium]
MNKYKRYLVTSALPYANGPLHIGQIAGAYLPADIYVRYKRMCGEDIKFICGSDEHGVPITLRAKKEGIDPQELVDKYHFLNKESFEKLGIDFDIYHRTSDPLHHETASEFFTTLHEKGVFFEKESEQYYDEEEEQFLADRYITGTCPNCAFERAYGDQCENCGISLSPKELINPKSALSGNDPVLRKTTHWYIPLDKLQKEFLGEWIESHKDDWKSNVYGQCKSWLDLGLHPRAVTRDLNWGVKVPLKKAEGKVLYVWFDAPIGYISATKALTDKWEDYWKDEETKLLHFIGKDNIVFHCLIFPAMLKVHGDYVMPENVPSNEFMNMEGEKISTSRNWAVWVHEYLEEFKGKEDVLRYVLCANMPETKDSDFTWKDYQAKNNNELVAILGNFINRTLVLCQKYFEGKVPSRMDSNDDLAKEISGFGKKVGDHIEHYHFRDALNEMMNLARLGNKYLTDKEPWKLIKESEEQTGHVLNVCLQIAANLAILIRPLLPGTSDKIGQILNFSLEKLSWKDIGSVDIVEAGQKINEPELLFQKVENDVIEAQIAKLDRSGLDSNDSKNNNNFKPMINFEDFSKLDIRIGTVVDAEKIEDADKLLKLTIDIGSEKRTIVSGIADQFKPEDIKGKQVSVLVNLEPRKLKGVESQGMVLLAEDDEGKMTFIVTDSKMKDGSVVS